MARTINQRIGDAIHLLERAKLKETAADESWIDDVNDTDFILDKIILEQKDEEEMPYCLAVLCGKEG